MAAMMRGSRERCPRRRGYRSLRGFVTPATAAGRGVAVGDGECDLPMIDGFARALRYVTMPPKEDPSRNLEGGRSKIGRRRLR